MAKVKVHKNNIRVMQAHERITKRIIDVSFRFNVVTLIIPEDDRLQGAGVTCWDIKLSRVSNKTSTRLSLG